MKLAAGIVISAVVLMSVADAIEDFMPLDIPRPQIKKTIDNTAKKDDILPPIENGETLTHADNSIEGLSDEEGDDNDEKATSRGSITSPGQKSKTIGSENININDNKQSGTSRSKEAEIDEEPEANIDSGASGSKKADVDQKANKFNIEAHEDLGSELPNEEPDIVNNDEQEEEVDDGKYDDGVQDEANNIADVDANDGEDQVNTDTMGTEEDEWGKEVHEDD